MKMFMYRSVQDEALEWEIKIAKDSQNLFFLRLVKLSSMQPCNHPSIYWGDGAYLSWYRVRDRVNPG